MHHAAALRRGRELEVNALALGRNVDALDLLEHLDAALHLRGLGRLVAKAIDEFLDARDLFILPLLRLAQAFEPRVALDQVVRIIAVIVGERAQREIRDARDDRVEEVAVVRDEDDRVRIGGEIGLEPVARIEIEMVGRLVEEQQIGLPEQQLGEREPHLPAPGEMVGRPGRSRSGSKPRPRSTVATLNSR